jgi:hypothetical protein
LSLQKANCLGDPRAPERVVHCLAEIIRFRVPMIGAGYEDGNDADALRRDPMFKLALDGLPAGTALCSHSTISRLGKLPERRALLRLGRALVEQYCDSFRTVPKRLVVDSDYTLTAGWRPATSAVHAYYDDYGFQPLVVFDTEGRVVTALLRSGEGPSVEIRGFVRRLIGALHSHLAKRRDPAALRPPLCLSGSIRLVPKEPGRLGLRAVRQRSTPPSCRSLREEHYGASSWRTGAAKVRRFGQFHDAAQSWSRCERINKLKSHRLRTFKRSIPALPPRSLISSASRSIRQPTLWCITGPVQGRAMPAPPPSRSGWTTCFVGSRYQDTRWFSFRQCGE